MFENIKQKSLEEELNLNKENFSEHMLNYKL